MPIKINDPELAMNYADQLIQISEDHEANINRMNSLLNELSNVWAGNSKDAYAECYEAMKTAFQKYTGLLEDYSRLLKDVVGGMVVADQEYADKINSSFSMYN